MKPRRGELWVAELDPVWGHEQGGIRPVLVVSTVLVNAGPSGLVFALPLTTRDRSVRSHIPVLPPEGGLARPSFVLCEQLRILSHERLQRRLGVVTPSTLAEVERWLRAFLDL